MAIKKLIIGKSSEEKNFIFDKQVNIIDDLVLSKELGTENIKNEDSELVLKSLSDTQIADVIQIKINLTAVGTFLVNFDKSAFSDDNRKSLLNELTSLKDKQEPTEKTQFEKAKKILEIVNKFKPEYVAFTNGGNIKIDANEIAKKLKWEFPLLVLAIPPKEPSFFERLKKLKIFNKKYIKSDYVFTSIFTILLSFAFVTSIHCFFTSQNIAVFLLIISIVFAGVLGFVNYKNLIPENDKNLKFVLMIYTAIGWVVGLTVGLLISKLLLTGEDQEFSLVKVLAIGGASSLIISEGVVWIVFLIKLLLSKIKK